MSKKILVANGSVHAAGMAQQNARARAACGAMSRENYYV
jgi:hypothetical protein